MASTFRSSLVGSPHRVAIAAILLVTVIAFGSYFAVQTLTENNVRQALLEQQKQRQIDSVEATAARIESDIDALIGRMQLLATDPVLQSGDLASDKATELLERQYQDLSKIAIVNGYNVCDADDILVKTILPEHNEFIGTDLSHREYIIGAREKMAPHVSSSEALDGKRYVTIAVPIINRETSQYVGTLALGLVVPDFFQRYHDDQITRIVAFDRKQVYISTTIPEFLGENYWGERVQTASRANPQLNEAYTTLFSGRAASTLFVSAVTNDERFVAGSPVFYGGEQIMSVAATTPTAAIYAQVNDILFVQKIQTVVMLAAVVTAISILIIYLSRWNKTLETKVSQRTQELRLATEQLKQHDKMQQDFINVAAHELRTPIQPMLAIAELMQSGLNGRDKIEVSRDEIEMLSRNANRLERLSSSLLEMARIESGSVRLNLEPVDISTKIRNVIANAKSTIQKDIDILYEEPDNPITVQADKVRLFEVISNLLGNAIKFTDHGTIAISAQKSSDNKEVIIKVTDTGSGIDPEIKPRLFTKFATKSESGTGIGLYISKNIIEAHGGRIWAENNANGTGATFGLSLPLDSESAQGN